MSNAAITWAYQQPDLTSPESYVLLVLADHASAIADTDEHVTIVGQKRLASMTRMTDRSVRSHLKALEAKGLIRREERRRDSDGRRTSDRILLLTAGTDELFEEPPSGRKLVPVNGRKSVPVNPTSPENHDHFTGTDFRTRTQREPSVEVHVGSNTTDRFDDFWAAYPGRVPHQNPKKPAREKFAKVVKAGTDPQQLIDAAAAYAKTRTGQDPRHTAMAITWLNQERWADDITGDQDGVADLGSWTPPPPPDSVKNGGRDAIRAYFARAYADERARRAQRHAS